MSIGIFVVVIVGALCYISIVVFVVAVVVKRRKRNNNKSDDSASGNAMALQSLPDGFESARDVSSPDFQYQTFNGGDNGNNYDAGTVSEFNSSGTVPEFNTASSTNNYNAGIIFLSSSLFLYIL